MTIKLESVIDRVAASEPGADRDLLGRRVREVIAALGMSIARDGEVYSEAPAPPPSWQPKQQNVRWRGGRRR